MTRTKHKLAFSGGTVKALLHLSAPHAEIVLHDDRCYVLCKDKAFFVPGKVFNALIVDALITSPVALDNEHAKSVLTAKGRKLADTLKESQSGYVQRYLFEEDRAAAERAVEPVQGSMFGSIGGADKRSR